MKPFCRGIAFAFIVALTASHASGQSTWAGTTSDWNTATNWSPNGIPNSTSTSVIISANANITSLNLSGAVTVAAITFNDSMFGATNFTLTGSNGTDALTLDNAGNNDSLLVISGGTETFNLNTTFTGGGNYNGGISFGTSGPGGTVTLGGNSSTVTLGTSTGMDIGTSNGNSGTIDTVAGTVNLNGTLFVTTALSTIRLYGPETLNYNATNSNATVELRSTGTASPTGINVANAGSGSVLNMVGGSLLTGSIIELGSTGGGTIGGTLYLTTAGENLVQSNGGNATSGLIEINYNGANGTATTAGSNTIGSNVTSGSAVTTTISTGAGAGNSVVNLNPNNATTSTYNMYLSAAANNTLNISAKLNGGWTTTGTATGTLQIVGPGTVYLSHGTGNSIAPNVVVDSGTLEIGDTTASDSTTGNGTVTVDSGATLTGDGTSGANLNYILGAVTNGGTISGGTSAGGTITLASSLAFQNGSTLAVVLNGTTASKLVIGGAATFAGTDNITFSGSTGATTTTGVGNYVLATIGSGSTLTTGAFTGTAPTDYRVLGTGTQLNLTHEATIGTITATPTAASIITGGSTTFGVTVSNTAPTNSSSLSAGATAGTNTTGSIASNTITTAAQSTGSSYSGLTFNGTTVGASQTGSFSISDSNADNSSQTGSVTVNVYGHADPTLSATALNLGFVHAGYSGTVTSNSVTATNSTAGSAGSYIVNLGGSATSSGGVTLTSLSSLNSGNGVAAGGTAGISATLANGQGPETFSSQTYTFADDSALSGVSSSLSPTLITVSGEVYSGTGVWNTSSSGLWGTVAGTGSGPTGETFGQNWGTNPNSPQGSPGLDSNFQGVDTATFGAETSTPITVSLKNATPNLNSITFSSPTTSYTLALGTGVNAGSSTGFVLSGTTPSINVTGNATAGTQTISAPIFLGANTSVNVGIKQTLTLSGVISDPSASMTYTGPGTTIVTANNTYTGGTTVSGGTLYVDNTSGSGTGTGGVTVGTGATLAGNGFIMPGSGATSGVSITSGGSLYSGGTPSEPATSTGLQNEGITLDNTMAHLGNLGTGPSTDSILSVSGDAPANLTFALGAGTNAITVPGGVVGNTSGNTPYDFGNPDTNSTYMTVLGDTAGEINFSGDNTTVTLVDTTNTGALQVGTLALAAPQLQPYLLIAATDDNDYYGLVTEAVNGVLSLDQNGYVVGVYNGDFGATPTSTQLIGAYTAINILQENNAMATVTGYVDPQLYLYDGDLEVVPEPGTWTLMLGGLALLVFIQQRRKSKLS